MKIIGITGTLGAGKGSIVNYMVQQYGFVHFSVRAYLIQQIQKTDLAINRDSMVFVANELRKNHSASYIVDELYKEAIKQNQHTVIESIRTPGEVNSLTQKGDFILLAVDADPNIRYERIVLRNSETDHISFEEFVSNENREMNTSDPNKQNLAACIQKADYLLTNNNKIEDLYRQIDDIMKKLNIYK
jgi:dephospho-CoA kinase